MAKKLVHRNLTDDYIINKLAKGKFVTNENDFNLKNGSKSGDKLDLTPVPGGLYDGKIFGSLYPKRCNCELRKLQVNIVDHVVLEFYLMQKGLLDMELILDLFIIQIQLKLRL